MIGRPGRRAEATARAPGGRRRDRLGRCQKGLGKPRSPTGCSLPTCSSSSARGRVCGLTGAIQSAGRCLKLTRRRRRPASGGWTTSLATPLPPGSRHRCGRPVWSRAWPRALIWARGTMFQGYAGLCPGWHGRRLSCQGAGRRYGRPAPDAAAGGSGGDSLLLVAAGDLDAAGLGCLVDRDGQGQHASGVVGGDFLGVEGFAEEYLPGEGA